MTNYRTQNTIEPAKETKSRFNSSRSVTIHCPFCGGTAKRYSTSYYCEQCEVDLDDSGNIIE